jgi:hypothetical protein
VGWASLRMRMKHRACVTNPDSTSAGCCSCRARAPRHRQDSRQSTSSLGAPSPGSILFRRPPLLPLPPTPWQSGQRITLPSGRVCRWLERAKLSQQRWSNIDNTVAPQFNPETVLEQCAPILLHSRVPVHAVVIRIPWRACGPVVSRLGAGLRIWTHLV